MTPEELRGRIGEISPWFHSIDLGHGVITPGAGAIDALRARSDVYFSLGLEGRSVLDVGAWDGYYSFAAEQRGAARVVAADYFSWYCGPGDHRGFELAHEALGSKVERRVIDIPDLSVESVGQFDIVLFNGIVYHIKDPIGALQRMCQIARVAITVETAVDNLDNPKPVMSFYPGINSARGEPTTGWGPNSKCMFAMLKAFGCEEVIEFPTPDLPAKRSIYIGLKPGHGLGDYVDRYRRQTVPRSMPEEFKPLGIRHRLRELRSEIVARLPLQRRQSRP